MSHIIIIISPGKAKDNKNSQKISKDYTNKVSIDKPSTKRSLILFYGVRKMWTVDFDGRLQENSLLALIPVAAWLSLAG